MVNWGEEMWTSRKYDQWDTIFEEMADLYTLQADQ